MPNMLWKPTTFRRLSLVVFLGARLLALAFLRLLLGRLLALLVLRRREDRLARLRAPRALALGKVGLLDVGLLVHLSRRRFVSIIYNRGVFKGLC